MYDAIAMLPDSVKSHLMIEQLDKVFKFGGGEVRLLLGQIMLPMHFADIVDRRSDLVLMSIDLVNA